MNKKMLQLTIASLFGFLATSATAEEAYSGAWYLVPGASYMNTDSDIDADNGGGAFIRLGKELSEHWDVQLGVAHNRADEDLNVGALSSSGRYKQTSVGVDALYMFSREKLRPFLLAGLGVARNDIDYKLAGIDIGDSKTSWMGNVGAGVQYLFSDNIGLQADVRQVWSDIDSDRANGIKVVDGGNISNTLFNIGGIFRFGAPQKMAAAEPEPTPAPAPVAAEPAPAPAPVAAEPAPAPAPVCKAKMETITIAAEKLFAFDKSALKDDGKAALDAAAEKILANPDIELVLVTGHTDYLGSDAYNLKLSQRRANQVKTYLVSKGVAESRLQAVGKGESEPVSDCTGVKGRKKLIECLQPNRRVVLSAEKQREVGCQ